MTGIVVHSLIILFTHTLERMFAWPIYLLLPLPAA